MAQGGTFFLDEVGEMPLALQAKCSCSREAVSGMLKSFEPQDRAEMVKDGKVVVTCEFCSSVYEFTPQEAGVE